MDLVTSGLELLPEKLTPRAIYQLSFFEVGKIQDQLFAVQVVSVRHAGVASGDSDGEAAETAAGHHGQTQSALQKRMSFQMQS